MEIIEFIKAGFSVEEAEEFVKNGVDLNAALQKTLSKSACTYGEMVRRCAGE